MEENMVLISTRWISVQIWSLRDWNIFFLDFVIFLLGDPSKLEVVLNS